MAHLPPKYITVHAAATRPSMTHVDVDWIRRIHVQQNGWCYSTDTEVLTNNGWKDYNTITTEDKVFTEEDGFVSDYSITYDDSHLLYCIKSNGYEAKFTKNHKITTQDGDVDCRELITKESFKVRANAVMDRDTDLGLNLPLMTAIYNLGTITEDSIELIVPQNGLSYVEGLFYDAGIDYELESINDDYALRTDDETTVNTAMAFLMEQGEVGLPWYTIMLSVNDKKDIIDAYLKTNSYSKSDDLIQALAHTSGFILNGELYENEYHHVNPSVDIENGAIWSIDVNGRHLMIRYNGCVQITSNSDVGYHFVIKRDGTVEYGRPITRVGAHVGRNNTGNLGICMAGGVSEHNVDIAEDNFTNEQYTSLTKLITDLHRDYPDAKLMGHNDFDGYHSRGCPCFKQHDYFDFLHVAWNAYHAPEDWYDNSKYDWHTFDPMTWNMPRNFMDEVDTGE